MESGQSSAGSRVGSPEADSMNPGLPCWWFGRSQSVGRQLVQLNTAVGSRATRFSSGQARLEMVGISRDGSDALWAAAGKWLVHGEADSANL